jgi:hypothetical protein
VIHARYSPRLRRAAASKHRKTLLTVTALEERSMLSAVAPIGPSPAVTIALNPAQVGRADAVIDWNATLLDAIRLDAVPATVVSRDTAMVQAAVYDAVEAIHPQYALYPIPGLSGQPSKNASPEAAAVAAAYGVLNSLFPDQQAMFAAEYQATLPTHGAQADITAGVAWGTKVANALIAWRAGDGADTTVNYQPAPPGGPPGVYEFTPGVSSVLSPQWGGVTPWTMTSGDEFMPPGPPSLKSLEYTLDYYKTMLYGGTTSALRTNDETQFAHFWADPTGTTVTPPGHWNEIAEVVSLKSGLSIEQNARMLAMLNMGLADAAINCWDAKFTDDFWRPVTAIRAGGSDGNPLTVGDPNWTPLWSTPNFPSYTSGHSTFSGAAEVVLSSFFGDHVHFKVGSDGMPGYARSFNSFAQAADEAGESRVVGGIHFEFDNHDGLTAGRAIGANLVDHFFTRLDPTHHGDGHNAADLQPVGHPADVGQGSPDLGLLGGWITDGLAKLGNAPATPNAPMAAPAKLSFGLPHHA